MKWITAILISLTSYCSCIGVDITPHSFKLGEGYITGSLIDWQVKEEGLPSLVPGPGEKGKIDQLHGSWNLGFQVGAGLKTHHDHWIFYAEYTRLNSHDHFSKNGSGFTSTYSIASLSPSTLYNRARVRWNLRFNAVDFNIRKDLTFSPHLFFAPHFGFKGTWQHQKTNLKLKQTSTQFMMDNRFRMWGIGLRTGLDATLQFHRHFGCIGKSAISAVWSSYKVIRKDKTTTTTLLKTENHFHSIKPVLEFEVGLNWHTKFSNNQRRIEFAVLFQQQIWFSQNNFIKLSEENDHGDLSLQGVTFKTRLDF